MNRDDRNQRSGNRQGQGGNNQGNRNQGQNQGNRSNQNRGNQGGGGNNQNRNRGGGNHPNQNRNRDDNRNRGGGGGRHHNNRGRRDRDDDDHDLDRPGRLDPFRKSIDNIQIPQKEKKPLRNYAVIFFDTLAAAKAALSDIEAKAKETDQLNIVIRAEATMEDPELTQYGKVFAGAAWALIHDRRIADGWYNQPQE